MALSDTLESWFEHSVVTVSSYRCVECGTQTTREEAECPECGGSLQEVTTASYATDWY
jgi:rRNA maturation endonuclease Nob1